MAPPDRERIRSGGSSLIEQRGYCRICCLHQWGFAGHRDFVGNRADLKSEIHDGFTANCQCDAAPDDGFKPGRLGRYLIATQRELGSPVTTALVGFDGPADSLLHTFQAYGNAGYDCPSRVGNGSGNRARRDLSDSKCTEQEQTHPELQNFHEKPPITERHKRHKSRHLSFVSFVPFCG